MGLFDHLFKSKSPPPEERNSEAGKAAETGRRSEPAAAPRSQPPQRADPSPFLRPKSYAPRGATPHQPKTNAQTNVRKPGAAAAPAEVAEIVITLGDVLSRIPAHYLKAGQHDPRREMRFSIHDLSSDIARGRAAVPLSRIAALLPDIFVRPIGRDEDTEVRLPLQKLVDQIGLLRSRPPVPAERSALPEPPPATPHAPAHEHLAPHAAVGEPARETLRELRGPDAAVDLPPAENPHAAPAHGAEPVRDLRPAAEPPAPFQSVAPVSEPEALSPQDSIAEPADSLPAEAGATGQVPLFGGVILSAAKDLASREPESLLDETAATLSAEILPPETSEPAATSEPVPAPRDSSAAEPADADAPGEKIQLSLAAILRQCPREILVGELPFVPDSVRITLPFAPIDRQLVKGHVEVSAIRLVAAMPLSYQHHFRAAFGVKVPLPLEEIFQNLPNPSDPVPAEPEPVGRILAPAAAGEAVTAPFDATPVAPQAAPTAPAPDAIENQAPPAEPVPAEAPREPLPPLDLPAFQRFATLPPVITPAAEIAEVSTSDSTPGEPLDPEAATIAAVISDAGWEDSARDEEPSEPEASAEIAREITGASEAGDDAPPVEESAPSQFENAAGETPRETDEPAASEVLTATLPAAADLPSIAGGEGTQTIQPPAMMRPPMVLPPPIFGLPPEELAKAADHPVTLHGQEIAQENTSEKPSAFDAPHESSSPAVNPPPPWPFAPVQVSDTALPNGVVVASMDEAKFLPADVSPADENAQISSADSISEEAGATAKDAPPGAITHLAGPAAEDANPWAKESAFPPPPAPLPPLPRRNLELSPSEVLPPPAFPLTRFDQDALQAIFMTEEALDLPKISRLAAQLPGVHACVIATRDQACTGGTLPTGFDLAALLGLAPRVGEAAGRLPIGELQHFTLYGGAYSVSFFERNGLSLCAVHRPRSFVPGVREKLVAIADELSKA